MKRKYIIFLLVPILFLALSFFIEDNWEEKNNNPPTITEPPSTQKALPNDPSPKNNNSFQMPIDRAGERITKKPFGIFITPQNSPVHPERFSGYHTGTDFETFPEEADTDVPIYAITNGKVIEKRWVSGYGGVLIESAVYNNSPITIIYGHLNLESINKNAGDTLAAGEKIGTLGKGYSQETDGERKHLHLGIHKGSGIDVRGYVNDKTKLSDWIDAMTILSSNS
jgi:murein DD-endopeptidase MepM/ murein hydrolase activator NlpD